MLRFGLSRLRKRCELSFYFIFLFGLSIAQAQLSSVSLTPANASAGASTSHAIAFTTTQTLPANGRIVVTYPSGFTLSSASATSTTIDGTFSVSVVGSVVTITRISGGTDCTAGNLDLTLLTVTNCTVSGNKTIGIETRTNADAVIESGSGLFSILPASLDHFTFAGEPGTAKAGSAFVSSITLTAYDQYNNIKTDFTGQVHFTSSDVQAQFTYHSGNPYTYTVGDNGVHVFSGSAFTLKTTGNRTIQAVSGTVSSASSTISVTPGDLVAFTLAGVPASRTAGQNFSSNVTVTAYDAYNNIKTDYQGDVYFSSSDPQAQLTYHTGNRYTYVPADNGIHAFGGAAFQLRTAGSQTVTVHGGAVSKTSDLISVSVAALNTYTLSIDAGNKTAGVSFPLYVTGARDAYLNNWSGSVDIGIVGTGHNSPNGYSPTINDISVFNGTGQASQTLVRAETGVGLTGLANGISRTVSGISVVYNSLATLVIRNTSNNGGVPVNSDTVLIGSGINLYAAGYDMYGNYRTDESANWTSDGTLYPAVNVTSSPSITFIPTRVGNGTIRAVATSNSQVYDNTGTISVLPGSVDYFQIDPIGTQVRGEPFPIMVRAFDAEDNIASGFSGTVDISDLTGTIRNTVSGSFINGIWSGGVTVYQEYDDNRITVHQTGASSPVPTGTSNLFDVVAAPGVRITGFYPVGADSSSIQTVTTNQTRDWYLKLHLENYGSDEVMLDSLQVNFLVDGFIKSDYNIIYPDSFLGSGNDTLAGGTMDSLLVTVNTTGQDAGFGTIQGFVYLTASTGSFIAVDALTSILIQTPAILRINSIQFSQTEVTRSQTTPWTISVVLQNQGSSDCLVDSLSVINALTFSRGTGWQVLLPASLSNGDWLLSGGETDDLEFTVIQTGNASPGTCRIDARVTGRELNTGNALSATTSGGTGASVLIEEAASIRISQIQSLAVNAPYVSTQQSFSIRVTVENTSDDGIHNGQIHLLSEVSDFPPLTAILDIDGHQSRDIVINGTAASSAVADEEIVVHATGIEDNTGNPISSINDTLHIIIQNPAYMFIEDVVTSEAEVWGGQVDPWQVKVGIRNTGQAVLVIGKPVAADIKFYAGGLLQPDYVVEPDTLLKTGTRNIYWGARDTLIFRVRNTGRMGGVVQIRATVRGYDMNNPSRTFVDEGLTTVVVRAEPNFRILNTKLRTYNVTESGNGYVNTAQMFQVVSILENGLGATLRDVRVQLESNGNSLLGTLNAVIPRMLPSIRDSVVFTVQASSIKNIAGEVFTAAIDRANYESSGLPAPVGPSLDSTAIAFIQAPARVSLSLQLSSEDGIFSSGQRFQVFASLTYTETGMAEADSSGRIQLTLPSQYILESPQATAVIYPGETTQWTVRAPPQNSSAANLSVTLLQYPKDRNTRQAAVVLNPIQSKSVTTLKSSLTLDLSIWEPAGATDGIVSTRQNFVARVLVQQTNVKNIEVELMLPYGYTTSDNMIKAVMDNPELKWQIRAPSEVTSTRVIQVVGRGVDALMDTVQIQSDPDYTDIITVNRADLSLDLSTADNSVSLGQEFIVTAALTNQGSAAVTGSALVTLDPLPSGYSTVDPATRTIPINGSVYWLLNAPAQPTREAVNIEARLSGIPQDENTGETAFVSRSSDKIAITTVGTWLAVSKYEKPDTVSGMVIPGKKGKWLTALELVNRGESGSNSILLESIRFDVQDLQTTPLAANSILSRIVALPLIRTQDTSYIDADQYFGILTDLPGEGPIQITFTRTAKIQARDTLIVVILGDIATDAQSGSFLLNQPDGGYIDAKDEFASYIQISVLDALGRPYSNMASDPNQVLSSQIQLPDAKPYLINCPNPFGSPSKEATWIVYYLKQDTDVELRIYTLTGQLVWNRSFASTDPEGSEGLHDRAFHPVTWDGSNNRGLKVLNGVYILVMKTGYGEIAKTKIALMK